MSENNYIKDIVLSNKNREFKLYALQLANMIRIRNNNVLYIFDEVGTGKTISAGLCIIELLNSMDSGENLNVSIITENSVKEQFKAKLEEHLSLTIGSWGEYKEKKYLIKLIGNHPSRLSEKSSEIYDLIIIDEAHIFTNNDNAKKYEKVKQLKAKKLIFLTATPLRNNGKGLEFYAEIAAQIVGENQEKLEERLNWEFSDPELLCTTFNPYSPLTRYFKDITRKLIIDEDSDKYNILNNEISPIRLIPEVWDISKIEGIVNKQDCVYKKIVEILNKNKENRFLIFIMSKLETITSTNKSEMNLKYRFENDKDNFEEWKFEEWKKGRKYEKNTYYVLTGGGSGENRDIINCFRTCKDDTLPTVIITNYQTSEVGVDFPGYNYVINYHINSSPSKIEQRFGRIDRMDSIFDELKMCFVINSQNKDTSTKNFKSAMEAFIKEYLTFFPSKNCLICAEMMDILEELNDNEKNTLEDYYKKYSTNEGDIKQIYNYCKSGHKNNYEIKEKLETLGFKNYSQIKSCKKIDELRKLLKRQAEKQIKKILKRNEEIKNLKKQLSDVSDNTAGISDKILFSDDARLVNQIESDDAVRKIMESKRFKFFKYKIIDLLM
ncbi:DEAD/DEAH box helicase family protein [Intestinibacter bartlettii]|uniref:DEAD/DEAH box helicase family protein n=1 Tax=Intestinibacter bartlettii TaxID=261299 RepID=UPI003520BED4